MARYPEHPEVIQETNKEWQSFAVSRQGEQRFGQVILGTHLPNYLEINTTELNTLIRKFFLRGSVVISRSETNAQDQAHLPLNISSVDLDTAAADTGLHFDDPDDLSKVSFDPDTQRHIIGIDFDSLRTQARIYPPNDQKLFEARLVEKEILKGLRKLGAAETKKMLLTETLLFLNFTFVLLDLGLLAYYFSRSENNAEAISSTIRDILLSGGTTAFLAWSIANREVNEEFHRRADLKPENWNKMFAEKFKGLVTGQFLVVKGARLVNMNTTRFSHPTFIRPAPRR